MADSGGVLSKVRGLPALLLPVVRITAFLPFEARGHRHESMIRVQGTFLLGFLCKITREQAQLPHYST